MARRSPMSRSGGRSALESRSGGVSVLQSRSGGRSARTGQRRRLATFPKSQSGSGTKRSTYRRDSSTPPMAVATVASEVSSDEPVADKSKSKSKGMDTFFLFEKNKNWKKNVQFVCLY